MEWPLAMSGLAEVILAGLSGSREKAYMASVPARPSQARARAWLDQGNVQQAGPGFTEAWPAWPIGNTASASSLIMYC